MKILQSKAVGDVIKMKNHIRHQHHLNSSRVYCDFEDMEVHVIGADYKAVRQVVDGFSRGLSTAGHGGYRISFETEERDLDVEESIRKDERTRMKVHLEEKNEEKTKLEEKWSDDRKSYEYNIERLKTIEKKQVKELRNRDKKYGELVKEKDRVQGELDTYNVSVYRIAWRRFKGLFGRK